MSVCVCMHLLCMSLSICCYACIAMVAAVPMQLTVKGGNLHEILVFENGKYWWMKVTVWRLNLQNKSIYQNRETSTCQLTKLKGISPRRQLCRASDPFT